jgi:hypothetical protein
VVAEICHAFSILFLAAASAFAVTIEEQIAEKRGEFGLVVDLFKEHAVVG